MGYALMQSTPCCIVKFITWMGTLLQGGTKEEEHKLKTDMINITIMDARKHKPGSFKETGFTLITLDKEPETKNWRYGSEDVHIFQKEMEKYLIEMYPQTKRFLWMSNLIRGGTKFGISQQPLHHILTITKEMKKEKNSIKFFQQCSSKEQIRVNQTFFWESLTQKMKSWESSWVYGSLSIQIQSVTNPLQLWMQNHSKKKKNGQLTLI